MKLSAFVLSLLSFAVLGMGAPRGVHAQNTENATVRNIPIALNAEGMTLYSALKMMFGQAKADFTIVDSLKMLPVTVHLNQPFRIALDSVLKAAGQPITYSVAHGIYEIVPAPEEAAAPRVEVELPQEAITPQIFKPYVIMKKPRTLSGVNIAALLGGTIIRWIDGFGGNTFGYAPAIMGGGFGSGTGSGSGFGGVGQPALGAGGFSPFSRDPDRFGSGTGR